MNSTSSAACGPASASDLEACLTVHLEAAMRTFESELVCDLECMNTLARHVEHYRGKMLRPRLVLLSAMALDGGWDARAPEVETLAAVVEMVHMATLVHDDVLDEADLRRGGATINRLRGNEAAVMLGDWLISHSYHLCASLGRQDISRAVASATNILCEGELLQLANRNNWDLSEAVYFDIIGRKTAALTAVACRLPALLGLGDPAAADAMGRFGWELGVAFQMADDLIDMMASDEEAGKSTARDLAKGKLTLPLIHTLGRASGSAAAELRAALDVLAGAAAGDAAEAQAAVRDAVARADGVGYAAGRARERVAAARATLVGAVHDSPARRRLLEKAGSALERKR